MIFGGGRNDYRLKTRSEGKRMLRIEYQNIKMKNTVIVRKKMPLHCERYDVLFVGDGIAGDRGKPHFGLVPFFQEGIEEYRRTSWNLLC